MLLGGTYNSTLLAAGFTSNVDIVAGQANRVEITLDKLALQWDGTSTLGVTNDFVFSVNFTDSVFTTTPTEGIEVDGTNRVIQLVKTLSNSANIVANELFKVTFQTDKLQPLANAENGTEVTIYNHKVWFSPRYPKKESMFDFPLDLTTVSGVTGSAGAWIYKPNGAGTSENAVFSFKFTPTVITALKDIDALLKFELHYYPFGTSASGGTLWKIRNGLTPGQLDDNSDNEGSAFLVTFGGGSPYVPPENPEATIPMPY
jgi:hypothetical protein